MEVREGQANGAAAPGLSAETQQLLTLRGLRAEDFIAWLGTQRQNGSDLKNWTSEELSRKGAYYSEVYGMKVPTTPAPVSGPSQNLPPTAVSHLPNPNSVATESGHSHDSSLSDPGLGQSPATREAGEGGPVFATSTPETQQTTATTAPVQPVQSVRMEK